jgi:hypothetical protein
MDKNRKRNRCQAKTAEGKPCRAAAMPSGLCFFHGNPLKASELGRKGGRSKRQLTPEPKPLRFVNFQILFGRERSFYVISTLLELRCAPQKLAFVVGHDNVHSSSISNLLLPQLAI